jgi:hypothetical protein
MPKNGERMLTKPIRAGMTASLILFYNKGNQCHLAGSLDFIGQAALVFGTVSCYACRLYLSDIRDILPDNVNVLIINDHLSISAELAISFLGKFLSFIV